MTFGNKDQLRENMLFHLNRLFGAFQAMPFQFFGEKEIHYHFTQDLKDVIKYDPRYNELEILREAPTSFPYLKKNGILKRVSRGKRALIDLIMDHPLGKIGFEFYFGKETFNKKVRFHEQTFQLRGRSLNVKKTRNHTVNDIEKLKNESGLTHSFVILLIASFHKNDKSMRRFEENKRERIIDDLEQFKSQNKDKISFYYIEQSYVSNLETGGRGHRWPRR